MALQACIDDSMQAGRVLVMAGYLSTAERWSAFSNEWQERLDMKPRMQRFKMSGVDLNSELQMERVRHFYRVIEDHVFAQVAVAIDVAALDAVVAMLGLPISAANPYHLGHKMVVDLTAQLQSQIGLLDPVDFVFDKRSEEELVKLGFLNYVKTVPEEYRSFIGQSPIFRDDEHFLPLQAADLLAWWARRQWLLDGSVTKNYVQFPWMLTKAIPFMVADAERGDLISELFKVRRHMQRAGLWSWPDARWRAWPATAIAVWYPSSTSWPQECA